MALYRGTAPLKPYLGDGKPVSVYLGDKKLAGWTVQAYSGASLDITGTYEDAADVTASGNTVVHDGALSSVEGRTLTCRTADGSRSSSVAMPTLRRVGSVADTYVPATGAYVRAISDVATLDGSIGWRATHRISPTAHAVEIPGTIPSSFGKGVDGTGRVLKYDGTELTSAAEATSGDTQYYSAGGGVYVRSLDADTGWGEPYVPSTDEARAYFLGWRMCNADGSSPYHRSEVPYTPSTWAEWEAAYNTPTISDDAITITADGSHYCYIYQETEIKPSTKYGVLCNVVESTLENVFVVLGGAAFGGGMIPRAVGNNKATLMSYSAIPVNRIPIGTSTPDEPSGNHITFRDLRVFELPPGSQIEADFANLTADQLAAKYTFNGLCTKNWQHVTDNGGQTATLPTASYAGYTPYRLLYQLATPTTTTQAARQMPTYRDETVIETDADAWCLPTISATAKVMS